jgi:hypothetical protein
LLLRLPVDGVDHAAGGQSDHSADERGGNHYDEAERAADGAQHAGRRVAHRRARTGTAERADDLAVVALCSFFNRLFRLRRTGASGERCAEDRSEKFHDALDNALRKGSLT